MMESNFAKFQIGIIPKRWYKEHLQSDLEKINNTPVIMLGNGNVNDSERNQLIDMDFMQTSAIFNQNFQLPTIQKQVLKKKNMLF